MTAPKGGDASVTPRLLREAGYAAIRRMKGQLKREQTRRQQLEAEVETLRNAITIFQTLLTPKGTDE